MANRFTTVLTYECWSYHATSLILVWVSGCLKNIFLENDNYLTNFLLIKPIVKRIRSRGFWAYKKGQSSRIYRPGFMDKHDHVISWNKDLLSQVSWLGKKTFHFLISAYISAEIIPELWNMYGSNEMTSLNNIFFKKYLWCKFWLHAIHKIKT